MHLALKRNIIIVQHRPHKPALRNEDEKPPKAKKSVIRGDGEESIRINPDQSSPLSPKNSPKKGAAIRKHREKYRAVSLSTKLLSISMTGSLLLSIE